MKTVSGLIDGIPIDLNVPETLSEYKEGARSCAGSEPMYNEGFIFDFGSIQQIVMHNQGVNCDLTILYFHDLVRYGIVNETKTMTKLSNKHISSEGFYSIALELRTDFCEKNKIKKGSILILDEDLITNAQPTD